MSALRFTPTEQSQPSSPQPPPPPGAAFEEHEEIIIEEDDDSISEDTPHQDIDNEIVEDDQAQVLYSGQEQTMTSLDNSSWNETNPLIEAFNQQRRSFFCPGYKLCIDESMCPWRGKDHRFIDGMTCVKKIKRKPKGVGAELKNMIDCETGIMLRLELVGNKDESPKKYDEFGKQSGIVMRLCHDFKGSGRTIIADSYFASVQTAVNVKAKLGLYFLGMVKTAHKYFPKAWLLNQSRYPDNQGSSITLSATFQGTRVFATGWADKKIKTIVSTCSTSLTADDPHLKKRWYNNAELQRSMVFFKAIRRPMMVFDYFDGAQTIDVHNHYRQHFLGLEKLKTKNWRARVFQTILGMCVVDAFLAYHHFKNSDDFPTLAKFTRTLGNALLEKSLLKKGELVQQDEISENHLSGVHVRQPLESLACFQALTRVHKRCAEKGCNKSATMFCTGCTKSTTLHEHVVVYCLPHFNSKHNLMPINRKRRKVLQSLT